MEELLFMLLLTKDMNKLFKFYWKKEQILTSKTEFCFLIFGELQLKLKIGLIFNIFFFPKDGKNPLDLAIQKGKQNVVQMLKMKGAKESPRSFFSFLFD